MDEIILISDDYVIPEQEYIAQKSVEKKNSFVKFENDPRITKVGSFIRKYSIDELPQLINILIGDMGFSMVVFSIAAIYIKNKWFKIYFLIVALAGGYGMTQWRSRLFLLRPLPHCLTVCPALAACRQCPGTRNRGHKRALCAPSVADGGLGGPESGQSAAGLARGLPESAARRGR